MLSQIRVVASTSHEGLIHMLTANKALYIVFSIDDIPLEGSNHTLPLYIFVGCSRHRVPYIILNIGFSLNICSLATKVVFGFGPSNFEPVSQTVQAYDSTCREVLGTLTMDL